MNFTNFATQYIKIPFGNNLTSVPISSSSSSLSLQSSSSSSSSSLSLSSSSLSSPSLSQSLSSASSASAQFVSSSFSSFSTESLSSLNNQENDTILKAQIQTIKDELLLNHSGILLKQQPFNDWTIERFLKKCNFNIPDAIKSIVQTLKWRQELVFDPSFCSKQFCREFYEFAGFDMQGIDPKSGCYIVWVTSRYSFNRLDYLDQYIQQFFNHHLDEVDRLSGSAGTILVLDCKYVNHNSVNLNLFRAALETIIEHYPFMLRSILIINLGFIWKGLASLLMNWLPKDLKNIVSIIGTKQLKDHMSDRFVYQQYGGKREFEIRIPTTLTLQQVHWFHTLSSKQKTELCNVLISSSNLKY